MKKLLLLFLFIHFLFPVMAQPKWVQTTLPPGGSVWALTSIGSNIFAGATNGGVYFSADGGTTWIQRNGNLVNLHVLSFAVDGTDLYVGADPGIYKSSDNGINWTNISPQGQINGQVRSLVITGTDIYAGFYGSSTGVLKSALSGISSSSWSPFTNGLINPGMANPDIRSLKISGTKIYAGTYGHAVWVSPLGTSAWTLTSSTMPAYSDYIQTLDVIGNTMLAGNISGNPVLFRSTDNGVNWVQSNTSIFNDKPVYSLINDGQYVYAGIEIDGMFISADSGLTWAPFTDGFKKPDSTWHCNHMNIRSLLFHADKMYAGTDCGVWKRDAMPLRPPQPPPIPWGINTGVSFYPNPVNSILNLKVPNSLVGTEFAIIDQSGNFVQSGKILTTKPTIYTGKLSPGMYIFRFVTEKKLTFKFLKQ